MELDNLDWKMRKTMLYIWKMILIACICQKLKERDDSYRWKKLEEEKHGLNDYIKKSEEPILKEVDQGKHLKTARVEADYIKKEII